MSRNYLLASLDGKRTLSFGKVYWMDEQGVELEDVVFDGLYEFEKRQWHRLDTYFVKAVEQFLEMHREQEIRFVPEGVEQFLEDSIGFVEDMESDDLVSMRPNVSENVSCLLCVDDDVALPIPSVGSIEKQNDEILLAAKAIEKFLILYRNQELRFVSKTDCESKGVEIVDWQTMARAKVVPEVDWWREREDWRLRLGKA